MKTRIALALWLAAAVAGAQINSDQVKKKTDGGLQGDSSKALVVAPKVSSSAPASPVTGQLWIDTSAAMPSCKYYNGSSWVACSTYSTMTTAADSSSFPGSPSDGQFFYDKAHTTVWVYDGTKSAWCSVIGGTCTNSNVVESFGNTVITPPAAPVTIASSATAGNSTAGTHVCSVTFVNSTGGETTSGSSASSAVSITASKSIDFSSIPTGGTGTTARRLYCSKAGVSTPKYWIGTIADNSTTSSTQASLADGSMLLREPDVNFSGALPTGWSVQNTTSATTSGGCGVTGSALLCQDSQIGTVAQGGTDQSVIASRDLTSWTSGNYVIEYRVQRLEGTFGLTGNASAGAYGGLSVGTTFSSGPISFWLLPSNTYTTPLSSSAIFQSGYRLRTAVGGGITTQNNAVGGYMFPRAIAFPIYVRIVKKGHFWQTYLASDSNKNWVAISGTSNGTGGNIPDTSATAFGPTSDYDTFNIAPSIASSGATLGSVISIDQFSLTVY